MKLEAKIQMGLLENLWRKSKTMFALWFAHMTVYRAEIFIWMLSGVVPLIMMSVWIGKASANGGTLENFNAASFAAYFLAAWVSQQLTVAWVAWEMNFQIRQGELSSKLLRPIDPLWEHIFRHFTERFVRGPFILVVVIAGTFIVPGTKLTPDLWHVLEFLLVINLAFLMRFLIQYCIGTLCFWFENATAFDEFLYVLQTFLAGGFAPLEFYPPAIRAVVEWTPFPYMVYYPAKILTGTLSSSETLRVMLITLAWVLAFGVLRSILWRFGIKKYGAVGA
jgi:ABC-2 type transport system permease protein